MSHRSLSFFESRPNNSKNDAFFTASNTFTAFACFVAMMLVYFGVVRGAAGFSLLLGSVVAGTSMYRSAIGCSAVQNRVMARIRNRQK